MNTSSPTLLEYVWPFGRLRHLEVLLMLVALMVVQSFLAATTISERAIFNVLFFALVLSAIRTLSSSRVRLTLAIALGFLAFTGSWIAEYVPSTPLCTFVYCCYIAVFVLLVSALGESVFVGAEADIDRIVGAVSIFFVLGLIWALIYSLIELYDPNAFSVPNFDGGGIQQDMVSEFIYFSSVTLTTLGYGDIVPVSKPARMMASLEAMVGQLYIAIVIARLVGLHIAQSRRN